MSESCVIAVTDEQFQREVRDHPGAVLVDFYTLECGPCRMMAPVLEDICTGRKASLKVVKINAMENHQVALDHQIQAVPTLVLYQNGQRIAECRGYQAKPVFEKWLDDAMARGA